MEVFFEKLGGASGGERPSSGQHFVEDDAQGINIGTAVSLAPRGLLGRHVGRGADDPARGFPRRELERPGQPEIGHPDPAVGVEQDVLRLEIPVDDSFLVGGGQGPANLAGDGDGRRLGQGAGGAQELIQALPGDAFHREVGHAFAFAQVVDADDVFLGERPGQRGFLFKEAEGLGTCGALRPDHLEGDGLIQLCVPGFEDPARGSAADFLDNEIAAGETRSRGKIERIGRRGEVRLIGQGKRRFVLEIRPAVEAMDIGREIGRLAFGTNPARRQGAHPLALFRLLLTI